jgi:FkbM family methyltransferase
MGRILVKTRLCQHLTIAQKGYRLRFYPSNLTEQLWVDRHWREPELALIRAYLRQGDHVIDVGANVGDTALTAAIKVGPTGKVWAIEAHPKTHNYLLGNIRLNGVSNIEALNAAAATTPGTLSFGNDRRDDMNRVGQKGIEVQAKRLDDLVQYRGTVDLLKIDVEGYELLVIGGATNILESTQLVLFEVAESHFGVFGYRVQDLLSDLSRRGFQLLAPLGEGSARRIGPDYVTHKVENLIAVRNLDDFAARSGWTIQG